jgi:hypothetical protein
MGPSQVKGFDSTCHDRAKKNSSEQKPVPRSALPGMPDGPADLTGKHDSRLLTKSKSWRCPGRSKSKFDHEGAAKVDISEDSRASAELRNSLGFSRPLSPRTSSSR